MKWTPSSPWKDLYPFVRIYFCKCVYFAGNNGNGGNKWKKGTGGNNGKKGNDVPTPIP
jgi:hypothetical protein